jgi:putative membrane protein
MPRNTVCQVRGEDDLHPLMPYCGTPPLPSEILGRFNLDPVLIGTLLIFASLHARAVWRSSVAGYVAGGWLIAAAAFISPLCALSVSLFSARIGQHMILILVAAPLIALGLPQRESQRGAWRSWTAAAAFFGLLWFWHMPLPYEATFASTPVYWSMHVTLFGSAILLWREILHHSSERAFGAFAVGVLSSMQMGLLGAILTLAEHPLFAPHLLTTRAWGFTPLEDQQLGGALMWVPGIVLFLWTSLRSLRRLWMSSQGRGLHEHGT